MKLLIKQRVFSWSDTYDVFDGNGNKKYFVKAEFISLGHRLHVYDVYGNELGMIRQKIITMLPAFDIDINGSYMGRVQRKFTMFRPKYELDFNGWRVDGDFLGWNYDVYQACSRVAHISKELLNWGDTYVIDIADPQDEIMSLMLVIAIDAANCSNGQ
jgi:uncharacterized protein YxjI